MAYFKMPSEEEQMRILLELLKIARMPGAPITAIWTRPDAGWLYVRRQGIDTRVRMTWWEVIKLVEQWREKEGAHSVMATD